MCLRVSVRVCVCLCVCLFVCVLLLLLAGWLACFHFVAFFFFFFVLFCFFARVACVSCCFADGRNTNEKQVKQRTRRRKRTATVRVYECARVCACPCALLHAGLLHATARRDNRQRPVVTQVARRYVWIEQEGEEGEEEVVVVVRQQDSKA